MKDLKHLDDPWWAEEALRRSETKSCTLDDSIRDAVMLLDEQGLFDGNQATLAIFGGAIREEFCTKHPADVSPPAQPDGTDSLTLANQLIAKQLCTQWCHALPHSGAVQLRIGPGPGAAFAVVFTFTHSLCPDCAKKWYPELEEPGPHTP